MLSITLGDADHTEIGLSLCRGSHQSTCPGTSVSARVQQISIPVILVARSPHHYSRHLPDLILNIDEQILQKNDFIGLRAEATVVFHPKDQLTQIGTRFDEFPSAGPDRSDARDPGR